MTSRSIEAERAYGVASKWLNDTKTVHVFVHPMEIPKAHMIVYSSSCHSMPFGIDGSARNCFCMSIQSSKGINRDSQIIPTWLCLRLLLVSCCLLVLLLLDWLSIIVLGTALDELHAFWPNHTLIINNTLIKEYIIKGSLKFSIQQTSPSINQGLNKYFTIHPIGVTV